MLYNGMDARKAARDGKPVIVVEGYLDVIAAVMAGFEGTVAPMGTALTEDHVQLLWRMSDAPILCFDGDSGGPARGRARGGDRAAAAAAGQDGAGSRRCPRGSIPTTSSSSRGANAFADVLERARSLSDVVWSLETGGIVPETPEARAALEARLRERADSIGDAVGAAALHAGVRRKARGVLPAGAAAALRQSRRRAGGGNGGGRTGYGQSQPGHAAAGGVGHAAQFAAAEAGPGGRREPARGGDPDQPRSITRRWPKAGSKRWRELEFGSPGARKLFAALLDLSWPITTFRAAICARRSARAGFGPDIDRMEGLLRGQGVWQMLGGDRRGRRRNRPQACPGLALQVR